MKQNPFSLYDFLGYFIPGCSLIYIFFIFKNIGELKDILNLKSVLNTFPKLENEGIFIVLIVSYVIGHIISYLSSITIETYANLKYGYPSKYLLGLEIKEYWKGSGKFHSYFWRFILPIFLFPIVILDLILGGFFGFKEFYSKGLDELLVKLIKFKTDKLINSIDPNNESGIKDGDGINNDFFRIIMHHTFEFSKNHQSKFTNYVSLYGFLRAFSFVFNCLFIYLTINFIMFKPFAFKYVLILCIISVLSYIFFMSFMKFYRRYTLEGFMVLVVDKNSDEKNNKKEIE